MTHANHTRAAGEPRHLVLIIRRFWPQRNDDFESPVMQAVLRKSIRSAVAELRQGETVCPRCGEIAAFCQWPDYEISERPPGCINKGAVPDA